MMSDVQNEHDALETNRSTRDRCNRRLFARLAVLFGSTFAIGLGLGVALAYRFHETGVLMARRVAEQEQEVEARRRQAVEKFEALRRRDMELVNQRVREKPLCPSPLRRRDIERLLTEEIKRAPAEQEISGLLEKATEYRICDVEQIRKLYRSPAASASVETLYRVLLRRPADPYGLFVYGFWWHNGIGLEASARDIIASPEFQRIRVEPREFLH